MERIDAKYPLEHAIWDQQYSRFATYLAHLDFLSSDAAKGWRSVVEFGGSNHFLEKAVRSPKIKVMPNYPEVDIQDLSRFGDNSLEAILLDEVLEHVEDPWLAISEVYRVLRPKGCLLVSTPFMIAEHRVPEDYWRFTKAGMSALLYRFERVEVDCWGNLEAVKYLMDDMMVTARQARRDGAFDLTVEKRYAVSVWAYAWK